MKFRVNSDLKTRRLNSVLYPPRFSKIDDAILLTLPHCSQVPTWDFYIRQEIFRERGMCQGAVGD